MTKVMSDETFDAILSVSHIEVSGKAREVLKGQISSIVGYFDALNQFQDEQIGEGKEVEGAMLYNTENDLRTYSSSTQTSYIEQKMLKAMNEEFMDGYFRTPKVLGSS